MKVALVMNVWVEKISQKELVSNALWQGTGMQIGGLLREDELLHDGRRGHHETNPQSRAERFGETPQVDHIAMSVE